MAVLSWVQEQVRMKSQQLEGLRDEFDELNDNDVVGYSRIARQITEVSEQLDTLKKVLEQFEKEGAK